MTLSIKHRFRSKKPDTLDPSMIQPSDWNDGHEIILTGPALLGHSYPGPNGAAEVTIGQGLVLQDNVLRLSDVPASMAYVGEWSTHPTEIDLGEQWRQNAVYKNTLDDASYILTGAPLAWARYLEGGAAYTLEIESSNGTVFRVGEAATTLMRARLFRNGAEITDVTPAAWFHWRRSSRTNPAPPNDDETWAAARKGFQVIEVHVDQVNARASFYCDIVSPD